MTNEGWGRNAASRFAKSDEEVKAEILKAIEGKLSVEFQDYSQWQRDSLPTLSSPQPSSKTSVKAKSKTVSTASRPHTGHSGTTACSSLCLHPWNKKPVPIDKTAENLKLDRVKLLQAQVAARKKSVEAYRKLQEDLQNLNIGLQKEICDAEGETHRTVTKLLEKYEKCSSATKVMANRHGGELDQAKNDYETTKEIADSETGDLEVELFNLEHQLDFLLSDLQVLRTYKDKEYPVKAMTITKLQNNVHHHSQLHKAELAELERIITGEQNQMISSRENKTLAILNNAADSVYETTAPSSLKQLTQHNMVLQHEIKLNRENNALILEDIKKLKSEVSELQKLKQTDVRRYVFPEAHHSTAICSPDEDVILDIPKQRQLPI